MDAGFFVSIFCIFYLCYLAQYCIMDVTSWEEVRDMHLKVITAKGVPRLYFYESFWKDGKRSGKIVESLGRLDELQKEFDDPVAHFKQVALERTALQKEQQSLSVPIPLDEKMDTNTRDLKNVGYGILNALYRELKLDVFWHGKQQKLNVEYRLNDVFRDLVLSRAMFPASKRSSYLQRGQFFEPPADYSLDAVYSALDVMSTCKEALQTWLFKYSQTICERDMSVSYFDCTNYYFDIGRPDTDRLDEYGNVIDLDGNPVGASYRKRGPEKNHRPDPMVSMGLLMDRNGIPLAYDLFPGNESEKVHMRPIVQRVKQDYKDSRIIFVADRGLNTADNIYFLNGDNRGAQNERDGYVYGQSIRGADQEFKKWVLAENYVTDIFTDDDGEKVSFKHKSRIHPRTIQVNVTKPGHKKKAKRQVVIDQRQMVYYSEKYARKQRRDREVMIARAQDLINYPKKYDRVTSAGSAAYIKNIAFNADTGEVVEGKHLYLDLEKIAEESQYDGYYSIVSSELKLSDSELRDIYRGLARIEDTFKVTKTDFETRPIFVRTNAHIDGHFATCFTALVLIRLLQCKLGNRYPVGQILKSLRQYQCTNIDKNVWQFVYFDEILKSIEETFHIELAHKYRTNLQIRRLIHY